MTDFDDWCESLGMRHGPAAERYKQATSEDELSLAAGEHLCLHAVAVMQSLPLPRRGAVVLRILRRFARDRWLSHRTRTNAAFCESAMLELCTVRDFFVEARRWPELSALVDQSFVMACVWFQSAINMDDEDKALLQEEAVFALDRFHSDPPPDSKDCLDRIMNLPGIRKEKIRKDQFFRYAVVQPTWLEPFFLMREYDRVTKA